MKIVSLTIKGYRSLKDVTWQPGDLNVIIGPNGSGKSNLLKALEMLAVSARGKLSEHVLREGGMGAIVWDGKTDEIEFCLKSSPLEASLFPEIDELQYFLRFTRLGSSSDYQVSLEILNDTRESPAVKWIDRLPSRARVHAEDELYWDPIDGFPPDESLLSQFSGINSGNQLIRNYQQWLRDWVVYQDFQTHHDAPVRQAVVTRNEARVSSNGDNLVQVLHTLYTSNRDFRRDINQAMKAAFGDDFEELTFPPAADQRVQMRVGWKSLSHAQSTADLSDGTLRFLYLITILATPNAPALIAIDEPETGLHPSMLPVIAEFAVEASKRTQLIFTTHSAEFLDTFSETPPTTTVAKWVDGETQLTVLSEEKLRYWLEEYTLGKLFRSGGLEGME